jgi:hypothetical protein
VTGEAGHVRGGGLSVTAVDAAEAAHGAVGGIIEVARGAVVGAAQGAAVVAALGRNPSGTARADRGATGGSKPRGISGAVRQGTGVEVPTVVSRVPMVETVEPDSQKKSRSVVLGKAARRKLSSSKTKCRETIRQFVERSR